MVILAAGQGTRMKSDKAKVLHTVGGKPMALRAVESASKLSAELPVVVVGRDADDVKKLLGNRARYVTQAQQLGTGHAVAQAADLLRGKGGSVVVFYADMPLLRPETLQKLIANRQHAAISLLTIKAPDPRGFGRIVRDKAGGILDIVEERDCTPEQKLINELNAGVYVFDSTWLWENLPKLKVNPNGEYYLTDTIRFAVEQGLSVVGMECPDLDEVIGVNTRVHLSEAEAALLRRIRRHWMEEGVTMMDPNTTYIYEDVVLGRDTIIYPNTWLCGHTSVGKHCMIGPNTTIYESKIGSQCKIRESVIEEAILEDHVHVGPFAHLRSGAYLSEGVHMGNFGEVKNSRLGPNTRMGHFSYIGDAEIGEDVNIGAGTITANFDGENKNKTIIGDHVFIGSDTMLIAPVTVESNAKTAAGSVVTHDVPEGYIAVGVPARLREIKKKVDEVVDQTVAAPEG